MDAYRLHVVCTAAFELPDMHVTRVAPEDVLTAVLAKAPDLVLISDDTSTLEAVELIRKTVPFVPVVHASKDPASADAAWRPLVAAFAELDELAVHLVMMLDRLPRSRGLRTPALGSRAAIANCLRSMELEGTVTLPTGRRLMRLPEGSGELDDLRGERLLVLGDAERAEELTAILRRAGAVVTPCATNSVEIATIRALDPSVILSSAVDLGSAAFRAIRRDRITRWADVLVDPTGVVPRIAEAVGELGSAGRSIAAAVAGGETVHVRLQLLGPGRLLRALVETDAEVHVASPRARATFRVSKGQLVHSELETHDDVLSGELATAAFLSMGSGRVTIEPHLGGGSGPAIGAALGAAGAMRPPLLSSKPPIGAMPPPPPRPPKPPSVRSLRPAPSAELELGEVLDEGRLVVVREAKWRSTNRVVESGSGDEFEARAERLCNLADTEDLAALLVPTDVVEGALVSAIEPSGTAEHLPVLGWSLSERLGHFQQVAETLDTLHDLGFVHAALRPSNVVLGPELQPRVAGALLLDVGETTMDVPSSPYASPEVRNVEPVTTASDVFSLGQYLHFLLLGHEPEEITEGVPRLESILDSPAGLVRIIRRCTLADASRRYTEVDEVLADLATYGAYDEVGTPHPDVVERNRTGVSASLYPRRMGRAPRAVVQKPERPRSTAAPLEAPRDLPAGVRKGLGLVGLILLIVGCVLAGAMSRTLVHAILACVGAGLVGMLVPIGEEGRLPRRLVFIAALALGAYRLAPTDRIAALTAPARLQSSNPDVRADAIRTMIANGVPNLDQADLRNIELIRADLSYASMRGVDLRGANLRDTYLTTADLEGSNLADANIAGADLSDANLDDAEIEAAICDEYTMLPPRIFCENGHPHRAGTE